jgi:hypothetical protein
LTATVRGSTPRRTFAALGRQYAKVSLTLVFRQSRRTTALPKLDELGVADILAKEEDSLFENRPELINKHLGQHVLVDGPPPILPYREEEAQAFAKVGIGGPHTGHFQFHSPRQATDPRQHRH